MSDPPGTAALSRNERLRSGFFFPLRRCLVSFALRFVLGILCKIDCRALIKYLDEHPGPYILAINHINFLEVPIFAACPWPRRITGLVNADAWANKFMAFLFDTYAAVPIDRKGSYFQSFRQVHRAMKAGYSMLVAPEGTRSKTGILAKGKAGIVQLALVTGMPVLPLVHFGGENFWANLKHLRRTPFHSAVGRPFRFKTAGRPSKEEQEAMLADLMGQIASLLPEHLRGEYASRAAVPPRYLEFI
jgi:1-acyl-sn-glycerol-3-phosphate acyltransferase